MISVVPVGHCWDVLLNIGPSLKKNPNQNREIIHGRCYRIRSEKTLRAHLVLLCWLKVGSLNQLAPPLPAPAHSWRLFLLPNVWAWMLCILWTTTVYWNRPQFILLRQAAGSWKPGKPSCSISLTRGDGRQSRQLKVRTELGQLKLSAMACAFSSLAWACNCWVWAPVSQLHQVFHSWPQQKLFWSEKQDDPAVW